MRTRYEHSPGGKGPRKSSHTTISKGPERGKVVQRPGAPKPRPAHCTSRQGPGAITMRSSPARHRRGSPGERPTRVEGRAMTEDESDSFSSVPWSFFPKLQPPEMQRKRHGKRSPALAPQKRERSSRHSLRDSEGSRDTRRQSVASPFSSQDTVGRGCHGDVRSASMPWPPATLSRVFAELAPLTERGRDGFSGAAGETLPNLGSHLPLCASAAPASVQSPAREVHVSGSAEMSCVPDRAQVTVKVSSTKNSAAEAKNSVGRRLDYITQSLQKPGIQAENITVTKDFSRIENAYHMEAEVCITFTEFGKMQDICNLLVEKLDSSVIISSPQFYHTPGAIENLRRQVCLCAVGNAWRKAQEVCQLVGQSLGKPLLIKEEETKEWEGQIDNQQLSDLAGSLSVQQKIQSATVHASSRVFLNFEVKKKEKKKK
ncbi:interleukin-1 receptor-associated kinase 1-binding protein 1 [Notamacropus eugenii]|uniref:interleukin-1 receptor-associated kinase 1-binding protein 1 n=1 Tax=Notamacropus eugenii TaxID=9315 RepID=UPI003B66D261